MADLRVLAAVADAGSARAVLPVLRVLAARGAVVTCAASGPALAIARTTAADLRIVDCSDADAAAVNALVAAAAPAVLLAGAGCYNTLEHDARRAARALGVPAAAVLDYWFEYPARFHRGAAGSRVSSWPDVVCAPDETTRADLVAAGCPPAAIAITGPPNIEDSLAWWHARPAVDRRALAGRFGAGAGRPVVAFFSEPYLAKPDGRPLDGPGGLYTAGGAPLFGYTAVRMLEQTLDALTRAAAGTAGVHVLVKAHPMEWAAPLHECAAAAASAAVGVTVLEDADPKDVVAVADAVIGMSSVTLLEAALLGKPVFSVQIGSDRAPFDPCAANRFGLVTSVTDAAALERAAAAIVANRWESRPRGEATLPVTGAAARVADVVVALARSELSA